MRNYLAVFVILMGCNQSGKSSSAHTADFSHSVPDKKTVYIERNNDGQFRTVVEQRILTDGELIIIVTNNASAPMPIRQDYCCEKMRFRVKGVNDNENPVGTAFEFYGFTMEGPPVLMPGKSLALTVDFRRGIDMPIHNKLKEGEYLLTIFLGAEEVLPPIEIYYNGESSSYKKHTICASPDHLYKHACQ